MTAQSGSPHSADGQIAVALRRAALAAERAARQRVSAERHERLAGETGREFHVAMATRHRRVAERHLIVAQLQKKYADGLADRSAGSGPRHLFMATVAETCGTSSAALTLVGADMAQLALAASDQLARNAQDLEFVLSIGPARDAAETRRTVRASGLAMEERWPGYGARLAELGLASVIALPLKSQAGCLGALTVFDPRPGLAESGVFGKVADALAESMLLGPDADPGLYGETDHRAVVHQAAGVLSEQIHCSLDNALSLIKARAFSRGEPPESVARRIVSGDLKLHY
ncbi:GAF and ANTAR domain-containing protein [Streptomyces sp. Edi4]|uniref:GAF and ANTAR domain-containing protein n=1 Tax=Streptomyces sp. Edi4 TaxID=3162527 RepID=UPI003305BB39